MFIFSLQGAPFACGNNPQSEKTLGKRWKTMHLPKIGRTEFFFKKNIFLPKTVGSRLRLAVMGCNARWLFNQFFPSLLHFASDLVSWASAGAGTICGHEPGPFLGPVRHHFWSRTRSISERDPGRFFVRWPDSGKNGGDHFLVISIESGSFLAILVSGLVQKRNRAPDQKGVGTWTKNGSRP